MALALLLAALVASLGVGLGKEPILQLGVSTGGRTCTAVPIGAQQGSEPLSVRLGAVDTVAACSLAQFRLTGSGDGWDTCQGGGRRRKAAAPQPAANALWLRSTCAHPATVTLEVEAWPGGSAAQHAAAAGQQLAAAAAAATPGGSRRLQQAWASPSPPPPGAPLPPENATQADLDLYAGQTVCCCRSLSGVFNSSASTPRGARCCCGAYAACCITEPALGGICSGSTSCTVGIIVGVILVSGTATVLVLIALYKRRMRQEERARLQRRRRNQEESQGSEDLSAAAELALEGKIVRPPTEEEAGQSLECPICLEQLTVSEGTWVAFPCNPAHGVCRTCLDYMLKHTRRRKRGVVGCPLCRKLALGRPPSQSTLEAGANTEGSDGAPAGASAAAAASPTVAIIAEAPPADAGAGSGAGPATPAAGRASP